MNNRRANFDRIARPYRTLEYLTMGRILEQTRFHYLGEVANATNALVLGDGDGRFLARLLATAPQLQATAIDISPRMLELLRKRCEATTPDSAQRLRTIQANALAFTPHETYDLVVTHFFLDCLSQPELESLVTRITPSLAPNARWLISDFRIPAGTLAIPASLFIKSLYLAFRVLTKLQTQALPNHHAPLTRAGFTQTTKHHLLGGILTTELWQISRSG
jgi:ubiquinone/menaquinone biosynthesis C-methylase UbiE